MHEGRKNKIKGTAGVKFKSHSEKRNNAIKYIISVLLMLVILYFTLRSVLKGSSPGEIWSSLRQANPWWIATGFLCMFVYQLAWAGIYQLMLQQVLHLNTNFNVSLNTSFIGFYFNNITPSASGGQPMQLLYLFRCGIHVGSSSIIFLANTAFNNVIMITMGTFCLIWQRDLIVPNLYAMKYALIWGYLVNGFLMCTSFALIAFPKQLRSLVDRIFRYCNRKKWLRHPVNTYNRINDFFSGYGHSSAGLTHNAGLLIQLLLLHLLQFCAYYLVPFFAIMALGGTVDKLIPSFALQSVLTLATAGFPTPGAVGLTEGGFIAMFSSIFPPGKVETAMILTRFINFYAFLILSGIITVIAFIRTKKVKQKLRREKELSGGEVD